MKYFQYILFVSLLSLVACSENEADERVVSTSKKIDGAWKAIDANLKRIPEIKRVDTTGANIDGPYPSDKFSITKTGKFFIMTLFANGQDSTWISIDAKSEEAITSKYPKLEAFKVRPSWINYNTWFNIRRECIENRMHFDLSDEPKGWLLENEERLK